MTEKLFIFLFIQLCAKTLVIAQHSPYSLQTAVEALHRHEAQLALKDNNNNFGDVVGGGVGNVGGVFGKYGPSEDNEYWDDDPDEYSYSHLGRLQLNQILARQLARERNNDRNYENELNDMNYLPEEKKRSFFRERDEKYPGSPSFSSVFRERELEPFKQPEMTEEFLREIQKEKELEREEKFRETLRRLWENYQQQENEIKQDIFDENNNDKRKHIGDGINDVSGTGTLGAAVAAAASTANSQNLEVNPYYFGPSSMERKRSYPVLPWLPATKKKRFPVAKRSPKMTNDNINVSGTDEKVAKELQVIFGQPKDEKKKRSTNDEEITSTSQKTKKEKFGDEEHMEHGGHYHNRHAQAKSNNNEEDEEHEDESDEHDEHEHEHEDDDEDEHDHDFDDDEDEERKKKREIKEKKRTNLEIIKEDQIIPGDLTDLRNKKSIQWSKYFGLDRKKKLSSNNDGNNNLLNLKELQDNDSINRKDIDPEKIESMNNKLKSIENYIIDETVKYTGAHEGIVDPNEIRHLKDHVVSRLATAYNLEKMRLALEKLRQSVDNENHLQRNEIEVDYKKDNDKEKRVAVKKEKVDYDHTEHSMDFSTMSKSENVPSNNLDDKENDDKNMKKKKRTGGSGVQQYSTSAGSSVNNMPQDLNEFEEELGAGHFEPLNDMYLMGNKGFNNINPTNGNEAFGTGLGQCPLLDSMTDRCRGIDILSGDINQDLLPTCSIHQLCYLCGTSQIACDFQYLSEADSICGHNNDCQSAARSALMILRGSPGPQLGPKECLKNPCLFKAMREIGL